MPGKLADARLAPEGRLSHALAAMDVRIDSFNDGGAKALQRFQLG
jgi:hypothetical protein